MKRRVLLSGVALVAASILLALLAAEAGLRLVGWRRAPAGEEEVQERYDSVLGWRGAPGARRFVTGEYAVTLTRNARGLRGPLLPYAKPAGTRRVLLLGDSYVEGYTVDDSSVVSAVLQRRLAVARGGAVEVLNGGTAGYDTGQELLFFQVEGRRYEPDVTVLFWYLNDVWFNGRGRYWRGQKPYFALDGGALRVRNLPVPAPDPRQYPFEVEGGRGLVRLVRRTDAWFGRHSRLYALARSAVRNAPALSGLAMRLGFGAVPGEFLPWRTAPDSLLGEAWRLTEALLAALDDCVRAAGSTLLVFYVPARPAVYPDEWPRVRRAFAMDEDAWSPTADRATLLVICARRRLACLDPLERFRAAAARPGAPRLYYERDAHWTPAGHALAAELVAAAVAPRLGGTPVASRRRRP